MSIQNQREQAVTREKLRWLEEQVTALKGKPAEDPHVRELTLRSLKKMINQMKEEIVRFEVGITAQRT